MQKQRDLKELSKQKCSTKGCKNRAESLIERVPYCGGCNRRINNKEKYWEL